MKFQTINPVTYVDSSALPRSGNKTGIVTMTIGDRVLHVKGDGNSVVEVAYQYTDPDGKVIPTLGNGTFKIDKYVYDTTQSKDIFHSNEDMCKLYIDSAKADSNHEYHTQAINDQLVILGVKEMSQSVDSLVAATDNSPDRFSEDVKIVAMQEFAKAFLINLNEIEEII